MLLTWHAVRNVQRVSMSLGAEITCGYSKQDVPNMYIYLPMSLVCPQELL